MFGGIAGDIVGSLYEFSRSLCGGKRVGRAMVVGRRGRVDGLFSACSEGMMI